MSSLCHLPHQECWDPSDLSDLDDIEEAIDSELLLLSTHDLGKVAGTETMEAFGLSDVYGGLSLLGANVVMVDGWSHHPQRYPLWGNLSNGQI